MCFYDEKYDPKVTSQNIQCEYSKLPDHHLCDSFSDSNNSESFDKTYIPADNIAVGDSTCILGKGRFSEVREAKILTPEITTVAVKIPHALIKIQREIDIHRGLDHKHLCTMLGYSEMVVDSTLVKVMIFPKLECNLKDFLVRNFFTVKDALEFSVDIASGMNYLVYQNIIHADLAARNCLLDAQQRVLVSDLGLAHRKSSFDLEIRELPLKWYPVDFTDRVIAQRKSSCIERGYKVKERGCLRVETSDVWSFGVLLYEIFSKGNTPFHTLSNFQSCMKTSAGYRLGQPTSCPKFFYELIII